MNKLTKDIANQPSNPSIHTSSGTKIIIAANKATTNEATVILLGELLLN